MARPRILLCPQFTEVEWAIAPQLSEWAEVATFDSPGVGDEPVPGGEALTFDRSLPVGRALKEVDDRGWDSYFVVGDAWGTATAVQVAAERPDPVLGIALSHASLHHDGEGERPAINGEVAAAMTQLMRSDSESFVRYGLTQFTMGGFDEEHAGRMVERFPDMGIAVKVWEMLLEQREDVGHLIEDLNVPLLFCEHQGCLVFTPEGFEDLAREFPHAQTVTVDKAPPASDEFAEALRDFGERVASR
jgi:pimeloyl-ACP methyl ester carboxylesterase